MPEGNEPAANRKTIAVQINSSRRDVMSQPVKTMRKGRGAVRGLVYGLVLMAVLASLMCLGGLPKPVQAADWPSASEFKLAATDGTAYHMFGDSVAISGDTAVVVGGHKVYVFARSGANWTQQDQLTDPLGATSDGFGDSVAISGDTVVVGAPGASSYQGSAYVFVRSGTAWAQQAKFTDPLASANDHFGGSVAISGDTVVVGAYADGIGGNKGSAYVFVRSGGTWTQQAQLTDPLSAVHDLFGGSVAINGDTVVVGASLRDVGANSAQGLAYVFLRTGTAWTQQAQLTYSLGAADDHFGSSVAIDGDTVVVGAANYLLEDFNPLPGYACVFVRTGTIWLQQAHFTASDGTPDDSFGVSVGISGDTVVVGAPYAEVGANNGQGSAYVFVKSGTSWPQQAHLTASDGVAADHFGSSVAISGDTALIGAPLFDVGANSAQGSAYVYEAASVIPTADAGGPYVGSEGSCITLTGSGTDPQGLPLTYAWDLNDDGVFETPGQSVTYCPVSDETKLVGLEVCNTAGFCSQDSTLVLFANVLPTVSPITAPVDPVPVNTAINVSANFTDPGLSETYSVLWNWGDGNGDGGVVTGTNGSYSVTGSHAYTAPGVYNIVLFVHDGGAGSGSAAVLVCMVQQSSVATATGTGTAAFSATGTIENLTAVDPGTLPPRPDTSLVFPDGMFSFRITGVPVGGTVTVFITLPSGIPANGEYWKYDSTNGWYEIPYTLVSADTIAITLTDGGTGDSDGIANGTITDPGGLGCIGPVAPVPELAPLVLLGSGLLLLGGWVVWRRRKVAAG
jgi:hypothetical protein